LLLLAAVNGDFWEAMGSGFVPLELSVPLNYLVVSLDVPV